MLTPKCRPRDFRLRAPPNSPKKCLCGLKADLGGRNQAGIRGKFDGLIRDRKLFYINDLCWLCREAVANVSLSVEFPDQRENTGNFAQNAPSPVSNPLKSEVCLNEFPAYETGNFLA